MTDDNTLRLISMLEDIKYKSKTGGTSVDDTLRTYAGLAAGAGAIIGVVVGAYVANETMEWLASDAPTTVRYAVDGIAALVSGNYARNSAIRIGFSMGLTKIRKVLDE